MQKIYGSTNATLAKVDPNHRYSQPKCTGIKLKTIAGEPDVDKICTSHIERLNLSVRTFNGVSRAFVLAGRASWPIIVTALPCSLWRTTSARFTTHSVARQQRVHASQITTGRLKSLSGNFQKQFDIHDRIAASLEIPERERLPRAVKTRVDKTVFTSDAFASAGKLKFCSRAESCCDMK